MSWSPAPPPVPGINQRQPTLKIAFGRGAYRLSVNALAMRQFKWTPGQKLSVQIGYGESAGRLRIGDTKAGAFTLAAGIRGSGKMILGPLHGEPDSKHKATICRWEQNATAVVVDLPAWARGDTPQVGHASEVGGKADVTPGFMGDPVPGRSARDRKVG